MVSFPLQRSISLYKNQVESLLYSMTSLLLPFSLSISSFLFLNDKKRILFELRKLIVFLSLLVFLLVQHKKILQILYLLPVQVLLKLFLRLGKKLFRLLKFLLFCYLSIRSSFGFHLLKHKLFLLQQDMLNVLYRNKFRLIECSRMSLRFLQL